MQTTIGEKKTEQLSGGANKHISNKHYNMKSVAIRPGVRTTELKKMIEIVLQDPDSVTREEFKLFQSAIRYGQAVKLMEEGKRRKRTEKAEQPETPIKSPSVTKQGLNNEKTELNQVSKNQTANTANTVKLVKSSKTSKTEQSSVKIEQNALKTQQKIENFKPKNAELKAVTPQKEALSKEENADSPKAKKISAVQTIQKEDSEVKKGKEPKEDKQTDKTVNNATENIDSEKQQSAHLGTRSQGVAETSGAKSAPAKATVKIKGEDPGKIMDQLGNLPPTEIVNAYLRLRASSQSPHRAFRMQSNMN